MRIPSVQNYYCTNYTNVNPKSLNKGLMHSVPLKTGVMHQDTFVKSANTPSFTGVEKNALVLLKQIDIYQHNLLVKTQTFHFLLLIKIL